jgi:FMN phosphatase YigB (HAD superfamily)
LIIFDLDDTLIDTSGCITPFKLEKVLESMLGHKPSLAEVEEVASANETLLCSKKAVAAFAGKRKLSKELIERAMGEMVTPLPLQFQVLCTPQAKEVIEEFRLRCPLALVTVGDPLFQFDKLKKAGIEASIFSKINVLETAAKKSVYKSLAEEFFTRPADVWVCGDRILTDLWPAHELGFNTVHMRWGRGKNVEREPWLTGSINNLTELRQIIR